MTTTARSTRSATPRPRASTACRGCHRRRPRRAVGAREAGVAAAAHLRLLVPERVLRAVVVIGVALDPAAGTVVADNVHVAVAISVGDERGARHVAVAERRGRGVGGGNALAVRELAHVLARAMARAVVRARGTLACRALVAVKAVALAGLAVADALVRALAVEVTLLLLRAIEARGEESVAAIGRIQRGGVGRERLVRAVSVGGVILVRPALVHSKARLASRRAARGARGA